MEIYFDDKLIDEDYYTGLSTNFTLFGDTFYLGSTASNNYNLSIDKEAITSHPNIVTVKNEGTLVATLVVDEVEENDFEYRYTLTDQMLNLEFKYDASELMSNGGATLLKIAQDICNKAGIELATMNFRGYNKNINWYDNTRTAREYIGYIAELNGGYAQIGKDGKLYFIKQNEPSVKTISIEDCSDFEIGEKHVITRVVYEQGTLKYEYGDETGNTLYLNGDNVYITEQSEVEEIFNEINGFEFYSFSTNNCPIDYNIMAGQIITFTDGINDYPVIAGYDELTFNGDWYGGYKLDVATKKQEETQVIGTDEKIRNLIIKVDRESNKITQAIEEIDDQNEKINKVTQTVDELNSKIQDIADITTFGESMYAKVELDSINESEPIQITVKPTVENISYLYPNSGLYPSETLYPKVRTLRFTNKSLKENEEGKYIDFIFPDDLLIASDGTCDEFYLGYDEQICQVIKRCKYNADGTVSKLDTEQIISYEYPKIQLKDGDYTIELLGYTNAYLGIRLMAQNIYTSQYATKAELSSNITQTKKEVDVSVNEKLINYATTEEMNSAIKVTADSINNEVTKKVNEDELGTKIEQNYEAVKLAWNLISEFIQYEIREGTPALAIKNNLKKILMSLNKTGIHFYDGTEKVIGDIGLIEKDSMKQIAFSVNGTNGANAMVWGVDYNGTFIPVFMYEGYNKESGTEVGGTFYMEAPLLMQGNVLYLGNGTNSPNIVGDDTGNLNITGDNIYLNGATTATEVYSDNYYSNDGDTKSIFSSNVSYIDALWNSESIYISDGANNHFLLTSSSSDKNLKKNIKDVEISALNLIRKIKHKQFDWKSTNNHQNIGYIAQEMQKISENFVHHNVFKDKNGKEEENWQINILAVLATATKAIQEQQEQIEQLQKKMNKLKGEKDG